MEVGLLLALGLEFFRRIKRIIGKASVEKLINIFLINVASFTLTIRAVFTSETNSFIKLDSQPSECFDNIILCTRYKAMRIGIFNAENHVSSVLFSEKIII